MRRSVVVDSGPIIAALRRTDPAHEWAVDALSHNPGRFLTFEAALAEVMHGLSNRATAWSSLSQLIERVFIIPLDFNAIRAICENGERWAPQMDFADACAVHLVRQYNFSCVLTTDFRDFSSYRVPFVSPEGQFIG